MMTKQDANRLSRLKEVQNELQAYVEIRTRQIQDKLLIAPLDQVLELQAQFHEVRKLTTLPIEIKEAQKNG